MMIHPQFQLDLNTELIVDNFAGGGGASTGIYYALRRHVDHAIDHAWDALVMHRINHPQTIHYPADVFEVDPFEICKGRPVGLAHFSPDCKHFSKAKGGQPLDKKIRGLVLVMLKWAKYGARVMTMENVEEITTWGPLVYIFKSGKWGWFPDPKFKGRTWLAFLDILGPGIDPNHPDLPEILEVLDGAVTKAECVRGFGYVYECREMRACDFGTPTIRKRLFMIARRDGKPIVFPQPTHFAPEAKNRGPKWKPIADCIDWHLPCPSIFLDREQARKARCKRPLARPTLRRIARGVDRYVLKSKRPFIVNLTHQGGDRVESVDSPAATVTRPARSVAAVAAASMIKLRGKVETHENAPAIEEPGHAISAGGTHHGVIAAHLTKFYGAKREEEARGVDTGTPLHTQSTENRFGMVAAYLAQHNAGNNETPGHSAEEPVSTISTKGSQQQVVAANLTKYYGTDQDPRLDEPIHTVTTKARFGLTESTSFVPPPLTEEQIAGARRVAAFLREFGVEFEGEFAAVEGFIIVDLGMRMLTPRELFRAQGFDNSYIIDRAWVIDPKTGSLYEVRLTKEQQIRMCGNSVCPQVMAAIVRANVPELAISAPVGRKPETIKQ